MTSIPLTTLKRLVGRGLRRIRDSRVSGLAKSRRTFWVATSILLLASCGGGDGSDVGGGTALPDPIEHRLLLPPSDTRQASESWANLTMQPVYGLSPVASVSLQSASAGRLMLWPGNPKWDDLDSFKEYVDLAALSSRFEYAYVYDELFWTGTEDNIGWHEDEVIAASAYTRSKGMKALVVVLPYTVLNPRFALKDPNAFDVIGVNVYPSMVVSEDTHGCKYNDNPYTNLLYCSVAKLRAMGFNGQVWYIYQAFGMSTEAPEQLAARLTTQRDTIDDAGKLGVNGIVPFGLYLGAHELANEAYLIPGKGSGFENLVNL